jgi:hypothetical protein
MVRRANLIKHQLLESRLRDLIHADFIRFVLEWQANAAAQNETASRTSAIPAKTCCRIVPLHVS